MHKLLSVFACAALVGCGGGNKGSDGGAGGGGNGGGGGGGASDVCLTLPDDTQGPMRDACTYQAGAVATDTITIDEATRQMIPIKHIIVLMKENRSYDSLYGQLAASGLQTDSEPVPADFQNLDTAGNVVTPFHMTQTCWPYDPDHQWNDMHAQVDGGKMDGFVTNATANNQPYPPAGGTLPPTDGHFTMGYYTQADFPFYYWLTSTFALADHDFASVQSGTWANRDYLVAATSNGIKNTGTDPQLMGVPLIFDALDTAGVSWQIYTDDFAPLELSVAWNNTRKKWGSVADFMTGLQQGTLPAVVFIDGTTEVTPPETDEHPPADIQVGENFTRNIVTTLINSPIWGSSVLFYTYDEAGGFADHVPPPSSCAPSPDQAEFTELGVRVPLVAVSPWAKRHFVSHNVHQHTSILRFIELVNGIPALTARDANSDALLDMFDFCNPTVAVDMPPAAGTGGCASTM